MIVPNLSLRYGQSDGLRQLVSEPQDPTARSHGNSEGRVLGSIYTSHGVSAPLALVPIGNASTTPADIFFLVDFTSWGPGLGLGRW